MPKINHEKSMVDSLWSFVPQEHIIDLLKRAWLKSASSNS